MTRRLMISSAAVVVFALVIVVVPFAITLVRSDRDRLEAGIERDASVIATYVVEELTRPTGRDLDPIVDDYARRSGGRVVITDAAGRAVADSEGLDSENLDFSNRPEVSAALLGARSTGTRFSSTLSHGLVYSAVPVASAGVVHGVVRITYPSAEVDGAVRRRLLALGVSVIIGLVAAGAVAWGMARSLSRPLAELRDTTEAFATGDLRARADEQSGPREIRSLGASFNDMADRIDALVNTQRAFVADASHQLRTPLTALRLRLDQMRNGPDDEILAAAGEETARLQRIVEGLLVLARGDGAREAAVPVDLRALLAERAEMWGPLAEEVGVTLGLWCAPTVVRARAGAVEQAIDNLLDNAIDHAPPGTSVEIDVRPVDDWVEVHVIDHGPGMVESERARAFDRFWRGRHPTTGGTGLGLAIVRQVIVMSGGQVELHETPGGGLDVMLRLEAVRPER
ncbi:MAG: ATP-binding protein [Acidimicrobiia bacterium]